MSKILDQLQADRLWIAHIDDERSDGNSIIVTLEPGWYFIDEKTCGVRGFDTVAEVRSGTSANKVIRINPADTPITAAFVAEVENHPYAYTGHTCCPHCGIDLRNGIGHHDEEVNGVRIKHERLQYECLGCGEEFGPEIARPTTRTVKRVGPRPAMVESLKLDRRITHVETGLEYRNACQVWRAGLVSASQGDRLSALLYGAAKVGTYAPVSVNGHTFTLTAGGAV